MSHKIQSATMLDPLKIQAIFLTGEVIQYNLENLFPSLPQFRALQSDPALSSRLTLDPGGYGVSWSDELDLDAETIWEDGTRIRIEMVNPSKMLAGSLARARDYAALTQKQLSERTGIYQCDISKIERGNANPSLSTLQRLADGMDMQLKIEFIPRNSAHPL